MKVRKFCACGCKLERTVANEESARMAVELWRAAHNGPKCGVTNELYYREVVKQIIRDRRKAK